MARNRLKRVTKKNLLYTRRGRSRGGGYRRRSRIENKTTNGWVVVGGPNYQIYFPRKRVILCDRCIEQIFGQKNLGEDPTHPLNSYGPLSTVLKT